MRENEGSLLALPVLGMSRLPAPDTKTHLASWTEVYDPTLSFDSPFPVSWTHLHGDVEGVAKGYLWVAYCLPDHIAAGGERLHNGLRLCVSFIGAELNVGRSISTPAEHPVGGEEGLWFYLEEGDTE